MCVDQSSIINVALSLEGLRILTPLVKRPVHCPNAISVLKAMCSLAVLVNFPATRLSQSYPIRPLTTGALVIFWTISNVSSAMIIPIAQALEAIA